MKRQLLFPSLFVLLLSYSLCWSQTLINSISKGSLSPVEVEELLGGVIKAQYGIQLFKLQYTTTDVQGALDTASGLLVVPNLPGGIFPKLVFQRGTIDNRFDVPSNLMDAWEAAAIAGSLGYVVIAPDLLGVGDSRGFHPYLHAASEASAALDMIFAAQEFAIQNNIQLNDQLFIAGYSQGGHSAMALHQEIETNFADIFTVTAAAHMSGPYSLSGVMRDLILSDESYPFPGFVAYQMLSYNYVYQWYDSLIQVFKPQFIEPMERFFNEEIGFFEMDTLLLFQLRDDFGKDLPKLMFQDSVLIAFVNDSLHPLNVALRENDTYNWAPKAPTRLFYCSGDDRVKFINSIVADSIMQQNGALDIQAFDLSPDLDHRECIGPAAIFAIIFFENFKILVGTSDIANQSLDVKAFPNPTDGLLTLDNIPSNALLQIVDLSGKTHLIKKLSTTTPIVDLQHLARGLYVVKITSAEGIWTGKIVLN
ncbi:MAG: T9SS type A sorting domain-containing protein [Saprospiraceae bacterium]|nr:T9SS type A sorting domain-containing protein [Saprospiraceae bacterium]